jgi:hypothetical protein
MIYGVCPDHLFHYVDSLLAAALTVEVIVMADISDSIWHTRMKYSPCFTGKIRATCSGQMYQALRTMEVLSH